MKEINVYIALSTSFSFTADKGVTNGMSPLKERLTGNGGFMGRTHALSASAVYLSLIAFFPKAQHFIFGEGSPPPLIVLTAFFLVTGASLLPDLDNVKSTAISTLGPVGPLLSQGMRMSARVVYGLTRTKYDKPDKDPHRGFWHTAVAALLAGWGAYSLLTLSAKAGTVYSSLLVSDIILVGFVTLGLQLTLAIHLKREVKKLTDNFLGTVIYYLISISISTALVYLSSGLMQDYKWVGYSITLGWIIHILGDTLTIAGAPILFPIGKKGHRWWDRSYFPRITTNGPIEKYVFIPSFLVITLVSGIVLVTTFILR